MSAREEIRARAAAILHGGFGTVFEKELARDNVALLKELADAAERFEILAVAVDEYLRSYLAVEGPEARRIKVQRLADALDKLTALSSAGSLSGTPAEGSAANLCQTEAQAKDAADGTVGE